MVWCRNSLIRCSCTLFLIAGVTKVCLRFVFSIYSARGFSCYLLLFTFTESPSPPPYSPAHQPTYFPPWPLALQPTAHLPLLLQWDCVPYMSKPVLTGVWCQLICCSVDRPMAPPNCTRTCVCSYLLVHASTYISVNGGEGAGSKDWLVKVSVSRCMSVPCSPLPSKQMHASSMLWQEHIHVFVCARACVCLCVRG